MVVGVVGSKSADAEDARAFMRSLWFRDPTTLVVSDHFAAAELQWLDCGGTVQSFRVFQEGYLGSESYAVDSWTVSPSGTSTVLRLEPSMADESSARLLTQLRVVELCDRLVVFNGITQSRLFMIGMAMDMGKPVYTYSPTERFSK